MLFFMQRSENPAPSLVARRVPEGLCMPIAAVRASDAEEVHRETEAPYVTPGMESLYEFLLMDHQTKNYDEISVEFLWLRC